MEEKYMVNDILEGTKGNLKTYENVILESENIELRQILQQIRNNGESFQYELFKIAQMKGYYKPAEPAKQTDIAKIRDEVKG